MVLMFYEKDVHCLNCEPQTQVLKVLCDKTLNGLNLTIFFLRMPVAPLFMDVDCFSTLLITYSHVGINSCISRQYIVHVPKL